MNEFSADDIAIYSINKCIRDNKLISPLQLQAILYYAQIRTYALTGNFLFSEDFEAWIDGPIIPSIWKRYAIWGGTKIRLELKEKTIIPFYIKEIIDPLIEQKRLIQPWQRMDNLKENSLWKEIYEKGKTHIIQKQLMEKSQFHN